MENSCREATVSDTHKLPLSLYCMIVAKNMLVKSKRAGNNKNKLGLKKSVDKKGEGVIPCPKPLCSNCYLWYCWFWE